MNHSGTGADFHERSNLACLVTTALIYPGLLVGAFVVPVSLTGLLIVGVILQVIALVVLHVLVAIFTRQEPDDERVESIKDRSDRVSGVVLSVGVFLVILLTIVQGWQNPAQAGSFGSPVFTGLVLFAWFVVAELTRMAHAAVLYRRG
jgi:TRAP-type C4-dicarboxylate transport system permease large subunit